MGKPATLQPSRAEQPRQAPFPFADIICALDDAALRARGAGVRTTTSLLRGAPVGDLLLADHGRGFVGFGEIETKPKAS